MNTISLHGKLLSVIKKGLYIDSSFRKSVYDIIFEWSKIHIKHADKSIENYQCEWEIFDQEYSQVENMIDEESEKYK